MSDPVRKLSIEERMFVHAQTFHLIAEESLKMGSATAIAGLVNSSLASELYLKTLVLLESGQTAKIHNLEKLFKLLRKDTRAEIEKRFDEKAAKTGPKHSAKMMELAGVPLSWKFRDVLPESSQAFVEWRYLYERDGAPISFGLIPLPRILRDLILERRPEWRRLGWRRGQKVDI